jgi:hypothetical protein
MLGRPGVQAVQAHRMTFQTRDAEEKARLVRAIRDDPGAAIASGAFEALS